MFAGYCYADEELEPVQENVTNESSKNITPSAPMTIDDPSYQSTSTRVSTVNYSNLPEANLGLNNILCIILISIGVLLILFAIAILIRLN
jgi:hypothetical protein